MRRDTKIRWLAKCDAIGLLFVSLGVVTPAHASACASDSEPWVSVAFSAGAWRPGLKETAFADLKAGLLSRGITTCSLDEAPRRPPLAAIVITSSSVESVTVSVEIRDAVTDKRVTRDVDLASIPPDGRALAVALAADELVWASWAEIALKGNQRRKRAPPPLVVEVERNLVVPERKSMRLGLRLGVEHYGRGQIQFGPDVTFLLGVTQRLRLHFTAGLREGLAVEAADGQVRATAVATGIDLDSKLLSTSRVELAWGLGSQAIWIRFDGRAVAGAADRDLTGVAIYARTGPQFAWKVGGPFWLEIAAGVGLPLRAIEATDSGRVITGIAGFEQFASSTIAGEL